MNKHEKLETPLGEKNLTFLKDFTDLQSDIINRMTRFLRLDQ